MRRELTKYVILLALLCAASCASAGVLDSKTLLKDLAPEDQAWIAAQVPLFECPDPQLQEIYYFRWQVYRKHLKETPGGYVVTEFLPPVPWDGKYNTICCAAGHHFYEGRWISDPKYLNDYSTFWFRKGGEPRRYSFWAADAIYARYLVNHDAAFVVDLLPDLIKNYRAWESDHLDSSGLYWQIDDHDGMEYSVGGSGLRPTINSYQYGDAMAISKIAALAGRSDVAAQFQEKAQRLKTKVQQMLWNRQARFFETVPRGSTQTVDVREEVGFVPWYFNLPDGGYEAAWKQVMDPQGFFAPFGLMTVERRSPRFMFHADHDCLWNGPSWPYATTQTLVAMGNLLNNYSQNVVSKSDYLMLLRCYARGQHKNGKPWTAEDLDGTTGKWIVDLPRSEDYNHSGYCDLIISGLVGLRPRADDTVEVNPLVPDNTWDYFALDNVSYHGHRLTILYDRTGKRYGRGRGLGVWSDGNEIAHSESLKRLDGTLGGNLALPKQVQSHLREGEAPAEPGQPGTARLALPKSSSGWTKYSGNPILGGALGTCFDVSVLKEASVYRMYFSWRPKRSIALTESRDGIHWGDPIIVLGPADKSDWEQDVNRPIVLNRSDGYHMWYTGQAAGRSAIGYATSKDGKSWTRQSEPPVLRGDQPWEKVAVMCPHVIWDDKSNKFRMWYSGGEQYEPDAIGYATSADGVHWTKHADNPIFKADPAHAWERYKVTACQVVPHNGWYYMFYIGFRDVDHAQIGLARSKDGIGGWERFEQNPIISPTADQWDADACYKPFAIFDGPRWMLWYNGRHGSLEQIGLATHDGEQLWPKE